MDESIGTLMRCISVLILIVIAYLLMFGQGKRIPELFAALARWVVKVIGVTIRAAVLIIVNTILLMACIFTRLRRPDEIPDCFIHYAERVADAVVGPYR